ncbi:MAG: hypothetical protein ABIO49_15585 [Dokdonella sp.]
MISYKKLACAAFAGTVLHCALAIGQTTTWRVVAGADGGVPTPDLPNGVGRAFNDTYLGNAGAEQLGLRVSSPAVSIGYWARRQGVLKRYMQTGVADATGPGRTGGESSHVFREITSGWGDVSPDGQRIFVARAGDPAASLANASYGLWRWNGVKNIEVARTLIDDVLGPGLGAGWAFPNANDFTNGLSMNAGNVFLDARVTSPTSATRYLIAKHVPGQGNLPCVLSDATDAALAPGLGGGDSFYPNWNASSFAVDSANHVYGRFVTGANRRGYWEICNGAPQAKAVDNETGARGPQVASASAYFSTFYGSPVPGTAGAFYFVATGYQISGGASLGGLFRYDNGHNRPIALNGDAGAYSPNWQGSTFSTIDQSTLSAGGSYASFEANVNTGGGTARGLWRARVGNSPEPVAILGVIGTYAPEAGRTWSQFEASAALANGDIVLDARTNPGSEHAIWLLQPGAVPRRLLVEGQSVSVPTTTTPMQVVVTSFSLPNGNFTGAQYSRGVDSWIGADGTLLVSANYGALLLMTQASDVIFRNGYDN